MDRVGPGGNAAGNGGSGGVPPALPPRQGPSAPGPARTWTVISSTVLPVGGQPALSILVRGLCLLALVVGLIHSGMLARILSSLAWTLIDLMLPVIILLGFLLFFLPRLGGGATRLVGLVAQVFIGLIGVLLGVVVRNPFGGRPAPDIPETSLHCRRPDGGITEVRVAQLCNISPGSKVSVVGPTFMGRRSAWWVRVHDTSQVIVSRGIVPSVVMLAATAAALWFLYR